MIIRKAVINGFNDALKLVKSIGCSDIICEYLAKKGVFRAIIVENIDNRAINILKQEAVSVGADAVVSESISRFKHGVSNTVIFASTSQFEKLIGKLFLQPFGLKKVALKLKSILNEKKKFKCKEKYIDLSNPVVMGIINMDPFSFSGDGLTSPDRAVEQAIEFETLGAGIIDIGAESSRPGSKLVDKKIEIGRLLPALRKIRKNVKIPISIDTYKYDTARIAIDEGADIINDIFALRKGKGKLAKLIADTKAGVILMHMKGEPKNMQVFPKYKNCTSEIYEFLLERKKFAMKFSIDEDCIAVDPGLGFGKNIEHNFELIKNMSVFSTLGAVVGAVSRKRFVKAVADEDKTAFVVANFFTAFCGSDIVRVHDVKETVRALKIVESFREV
ncbi:MAG: dihydropteroate synthase [Endomicrobium sp.]|jgi:dihydropteroate synthase|nr:dihydropteroate synthase [Endomicrobium sp.]